MVNTELPDPSCISKAEVEARFCTIAPYLFTVNRAVPVEEDNLNISLVLAVA